MRGRKKGLLDKIQQTKLQENRDKVLKAYEKFIGQGESPTISMMEEATGLSRPSIKKHLKPIQEKEQEERSRLHEETIKAILDDYEGFLSEVDEHLKAMKTKAEKMYSSSFGFFRFLLDRNLFGKIRERTNVLRPIFLRRIDQLEHSLKIDMQAKREPNWLIGEFCSRKLGAQIIKLFYIYLYGFGLENSLEDAKCRITIDFDPFNGTIEFLADRIAQTESNLIHGIVWDFSKEVNQLLVDDVEHYRLTAIANNTYREEDLKQYKVNVFKIVKTRILALSKKHKTNDGLVAIWLPHLKKLLDNYTPNIL